MINVGDKWSRYEFLIGDRFGLLVTYLADFFTKIENLL